MDTPIINIAIIPIKYYRRHFLYKKFPAFLGFVMVQTCLVKLADNRKNFRQHFVLSVPDNGSSQLEILRAEPRFFFHKARWAGLKCQYTVADNLLAFPLNYWLLCYFLAHTTRWTRKKRGLAKLSIQTVFPAILRTISEIWSFSTCRDLSLGITLQKCRYPRQPVNHQYIVVPLWMLTRTNHCGRRILI